MMNDKISSALKTDSETIATIGEPIDLKENAEIAKIHTSDEEIESYYIVKNLLVGLVKAEEITYKDNERYFSILFKGNIRKPICRINLDTKKKQIMIPDDNKDFSRTYIDSINDIFAFKDNLIKVVSKYIEN